MDLRRMFRDTFGSDPALAAKAPGRVNLIGEHTDYNDGYVLPVAIQYHTTVVAGPRSDRRIHLVSVDFKQDVSLRLEQSIAKSADRPWSNYEKGVLVEFQKMGIPLRGANLLIQGNVPIGAGLSSSASVEMAMATAWRALQSVAISDTDMIRLCQRAENEFVGMKCGIMDQFISCMGKDGHALFLDCRSLEYEWIPFPSDAYSVVILNTKKMRELTGSEYNTRRSQCEEGVHELRSFLPNIRALRDVSVGDFETYGKTLSNSVRKRCEHVVKENQRVLDFKDALKTGKQELLGRLLLESHESLRDLYEVSCNELDALVDIAMHTDGVIGARMTGAGFGGCAIAVVAKGKEKQLEANVLSEYPARTGIQPEVYVSSPSQGATVERFA